MHSSISKDILRGQNAFASHRSTGREGISRAVAAAATNHEVLACATVEVDVSDRDSNTYLACEVSSLTRAEGASCVLATAISQGNLAYASYISAKHSLRAYY
jgi:hypothetical protein